MASPGLLTSGTLVGLGEAAWAPISCGFLLHWPMGCLLKPQLILKALVAPAWPSGKEIGKSHVVGACVTH